MNKRFKRTRLLLGALLAGSAVFSVGNCTTDEIKVQFSKGLSSTLNGIFGITSADVADELFDVDD